MPEALKELPRLTDYHHYLELFTLLRSRYAKTENIPLSEIAEGARVFELPIRRSVVVISGCDSVWLQTVNRK